MARLAPECLDLLLYSQRSLEVFRTGQVCQTCVHVGGQRTRQAFLGSVAEHPRARVREELCPGLAMADRRRRVPKEVSICIKGVDSFHLATHPYPNPEPIISGTFDS